VRLSTPFKSLAIVTLTVMLASCGGGGRDTSSPTPTTKAEPATTLATTTTFVVPPTTTPIVEGEIFTQKIVAWGEKAISESGIFTLQARGEEPGDLDDTVTLVYSLCATQDTPLMDEGYDEILDVVEVPSDGLFSLNDSSDDDGILLYEKDSVLSIDDSATAVKKLPEYDGSETTRLTSVIKKDQCTSVRLQIYDKDRGKLIIGFAYTTIPHGEWRPSGDFAQTAEAEKASSFGWEYWVN